MTEEKTKMSPEEMAQQEFETAINYLKALEVLCKKQQTDLDTHIARIDMLRFLADRVKSLRDLEIKLSKNTNSDQGYAVTATQ